MATGFLLLAWPTTFHAGWALLYGADVAGILHASRYHLYVQSLVSLVPLAWMAIVNLATVSPGAKGSSGNRSYRVFFLAACAVSGFYWLSAAAQYSLWHQPFAVWAGAATLMAHLSVFTAMFLLFQWIDWGTAYFKQSWIVGFAVKAAAVWMVLSLVLRRVLFSALAFNSARADYYALCFCLVAVIYAAGLVLRIREHATISCVGLAAPSRFRWLLVRISAVLASLALSYVALVRLARVDWNHIGGMLVAMATWLLAWLIFFRGSTRWKPYRVAFLVTLSALDLIALAAVRWSTGERAQENPGLAAMEQYVAYDPSFAAIHQAVRETVRESSYGDFYGFLARHADIRHRIPAPEVDLADGLAPTSGTRPHIFVFVIDALRRDYVSAYNPAVTFTPAFQSFAAESVVFENAYTPFAGTVLAEPTIWTGVQMPHRYPDPLPRMNSLKRMLDADKYDCYISYDTVLQSLVPISPNVTVIQSGLASWKDKEFTAVVKELEEDLLARGNKTQPVFAYSQPENVHSLSVVLFGKTADVTPHPGFESGYASAVQEVDQAFGEFVRFLKDHGYYDNSVIVLTADHGESLGEWGRHGHVAYLTPETMRIPMIIHLPEKMKADLAWDVHRPVFLQDVTPTLYYLLGHRPIKQNALYGRPLFTHTAKEQAEPRPDHYLLMSSYLPVFGLLSGDENSLYIVDAAKETNYFYDLRRDPEASTNRITAPLRKKYADLLRKDLEKLDAFYGASAMNH
ncbi:MAG TPA: sulfatase-like hydrolase/transferase [Candidatus Angelobacter sp.]